MVKKVKSISDKPFMPGISNAASVAAQQKVNDLKLGSIMTLPVAGGGSAQFEFIRIKAGAIEKRSYVDGVNAREQVCLNRISLNDILPTIKKHGQQFPAIGRFAKDGKIEVLDGSRRRMSCILAETDFFILATKEALSDEQAKYVSDIANVSKPLSLYEQGAQFKQLLKVGKYEDQKSLAVGEGVHEPVVSSALKAHAILFDIIGGFPVLNELGRPTINKLHKLTTQLEGHPSNSLCMHLQQFSLETLIDLCDGSENANTLNKRYMQEIETFVATLVEPEKPLKKPASPLVASNGKAKATLKESKNGFALDVSHVDEGTKNKILEMVRQLIEDC